jgi:hypothetical protein
MTTIPGTDDALPAAPSTGAAEAADAAAGPIRRPVWLSWFDAEAGQTLSIEMWGTEEFLDDLLRQGFVERELEPLESDPLLCARILQGQPDEH